MNKEINIEITREKKVFERYFYRKLRKHLTKSYLDKAMLYSSLNGGKRIRPYLVKTFSKIKGVRSANYNKLSTAVEVIHSYSLIHDDLPSMDNDDYRRGKPSTHKKFNEAQAILAGDSLHDLAFEILSEKNNGLNSKTALKLINCLSKSLGSSGLAGGQSLDLIYEKKQISIKKIFEMYKMKTGTLFQFCCAGPFIISKANSKEINFALKFGEFFGLIFQITDDYLDTISTKNILGKTPGKDIKQNKSTILRIIGNKKIKEYCEDLTSKFKKANNYYLKKWSKLDKLLNYLNNRI